MEAFESQHAERVSELPPWPRRIGSFLVVYIACALMFQLGGATPAWGPESSLEAFSAGLFGMLAVMSFLLARQAVRWHRIFWIASFIALTTLGIDELFELHESTGAGMAGDHLKVALWLGAAGALATVHWLERPSRGAQLAMLAGYALHTLYLGFELGDGGYFELTLLSEELRGTCEELCEVLMLSAYLFAFGAMASERGLDHEEIADAPPDEVARDAA